MRTFEAYMIALDNEKIGTIINNMNWNVFFAENARYEFMTSDRPVIKTFLNHDNAHIALPIGPHALFVAAKDERVLAEIQRVAQNDLVKTVNMRVVQQARRFVYATNEAQRSFVQKYFGADEMQTHLAPLPT